MEIVLHYFEKPHEERYLSRTSIYTTVKHQSSSILRQDMIMLDGKRFFTKK